MRQCGCVSPHGVSMGIMVRVHGYRGKGSMGMHFLCSSLQLSQPKGTWRGGCWWRAGGSYIGAGPWSSGPYISQCSCSMSGSTSRSVPIHWLAWDPSGQCGHVLGQQYQPVVVPVTLESTILCQHLNSLTQSSAWPMNELASTGGSTLWPDVRVALELWLPLGQ